MKYKIYHAKNPTFGFGQDPKFPEEYEEVAIVEANSVDDTFKITNHIDENWTRNPEVVELINHNPRSTSVGDVVEDEEGKFHYCDMVGWKEIK